MAKGAFAKPDPMVSFGEMLIDFVPTEKDVSLAKAPSFLKDPGGAPANVAIAVTQLGGQAAFISKLGDDEFGHMLVKILCDNNVTNIGITFNTRARTVLAFIALRADGERDFMFYRHPSANMLLTESELNLDLIRSVKVSHYGSISLIAEPCRSAHLRAMEVAKEAGALLSYDPNLWLPLWPSLAMARKQITSIWGLADVIKVNDDELKFLTGRNSVGDEVAMTLWRPNLKLLLVTVGKEGCRCYARDFRGTVESFVIQQVDTTGAGDVFVGAILQNIVEEPLALQDEKKLREVLRFANACGAITTTKKGAIPSLPTRAEAMQLMGRP